MCAPPSGHRSGDRSHPCLPNCCLMSLKSDEDFTPAAFARLAPAFTGIAVAVVLFFASVSRHLLPGAFNDDAVYMTLGRALSTGVGYRSIYLVGAPLQVKYPPGLPALLAILWRIAKTPGHVQALATVINIAACGMAAGIFCWIGCVRLRMPTALVVAFGILPFVLDPAVQYFTLVLSEPLFILATAAALLLYDRLRVLDATMASSRPRMSSAVALGAALAAATLIRTQGVALMLAILLAMSLDRMRRRELLIAAVVAITPVLAWQAHVLLQAQHAVLATQASETNYITFLRGGTPGAIALREVAAIRGNAADYVSLIGTYLSGWRTAGLLASIAALLLAASGTVFLVRGQRALSFALIANVAVLLAWPVYQDRFLLPALPLLGLVAGYAAHVMTKHVQARVHAEWPRVAVTAMVALGGLFVFVRQHEIRRDNDVARREGRPPAAYSPSYWLPGNAWFVETVSRWALQSTKPDDRIAVVSPAGLWLYTGRQTVPMEIVEPRGMPSVFDASGRYLIAHLVSDSVTVVVVESPFGATARETAAVRAACPRALQPMEGASGVTAFRAVPGDPCVIAANKRLQAEGRVRRPMQTNLAHSSRGGRMRTL